MNLKTMSTEALNDLSSRLLEELDIIHDLPDAERDQNDDKRSRQINKTLDAIERELRKRI